MDKSLLRQADEIVARLSPGKREAVREIVINSVHRGLVDERARHYLTVASGGTELADILAAALHSGGEQSAISVTSARAVSAAIDPFARVANVEHFALSSVTVADGAELPRQQRSAEFGAPGGEDISPDLVWSGAPERTRSFVVTMFDSDAATGSGFWHWAVKDIPVSTTALELDAGRLESTTMPEGAVQLPGDAGMPRYIGAAPPKGDPPHHYWITVWALDVSRVDVPDTSSAALLMNVMRPHIVARAGITPIASA